MQQRPASHFKICSMQQSVVILLTGLYVSMCIFKQIQRTLVTLTIY